MKRAIVLLLVLLTLLLPVFVTGGFYRHILIMTAINVILAVGLWTIMRVGQLSIGHAAFMAIGAYTSALLTIRLEWSFWLALPISAVASGVAALLVGYPTLRLKGLFFALTTFAFAEILRIVLNTYWRDVFGGASGITGIPHPRLFNIDFRSDLPYYYLVVALMLLVILLVYRVDKSRIGMTFASISQADNLAESLGIDTMKFKVMAFVIGSGIAGLAGSLFAHYYSFISPEQFTFSISVYVLIYVVVGGAGLIIGPIVGACALSVFHESFRTFGSYEPIVYGSALVLVVLFLPQGLISLPSRTLAVLSRLARLRAREPAAAE